MEGHTNSVRTVAFSPTGKVLASGSSDSTIILWDIELQTSWKRNAPSLTQIFTIDKKLID
uniref:Uncharacterized protein n=1 Tax=Arcella intermedia TaxID=1963864 RepID=A0A6B2LW93_9EUKA